MQAETPPRCPKFASRSAAAGGEGAGDDGADAAKTPPRASSPPPEVKQAPDEARGRTPTQGVETRAGQRVAETGARGQGFGLSTGGGAGSGSTLDVGDFCCPDYIALMVERIRSELGRAGRECPGHVVVKFTIQRDGTIAERRRSKNRAATPRSTSARCARVVGDAAAAAAAGAFPNPTLTVHLNFEYRR